MTSGYGLTLVKYTVTGGELGNLFGFDTGAYRRGLLHRSYATSMRTPGRCDGNVTVM